MHYITYRLTNRLHNIGLSSHGNWNWSTTGLCLCTIGKTSLWKSTVTTIWTPYFNPVPSDFWTTLALVWAAQERDLFLEMVIVSCKTGCKNEHRKKISQLGKPSKVKRSRLLSLLFQFSMLSWISDQQLISDIASNVCLGAWFGVGLEFGLGVELADCQTLCRTWCSFKSDRKKND